jgi:N-acetyl-gamma-glutamyl-phosphate reductase
VVDDAAADGTVVAGAARDFGVIRDAGKSVEAGKSVPVGKSLAAGVLGASGFAGGELLRLLAGHPYFEVVVAGADRHAGSDVADVHPHLGLYRGLSLTAPEPSALDGLDVVFLALPHGASGVLVPDLVGRVGLIVDLAADFRLRDPAAYPEWYGAPHPAPGLLAQAVHGIPELVGDRLVGARLVAAAGCYVTAAALALAPLVASGTVEAAGVIVDAASGVSGAGADPRPATRFATVDGDFSVYGLLTHRHTPEIEQATGAEVLFTPHLAPMSRGILATCYARPASGADPLEVLADAYASSPFVTVSERCPSTKAVLGSNAAQLTARADRRTGWVISICAIDNLVKGAAGQAIQCANLALGLPETTGLPVAGLWP